MARRGASIPDHRLMSEVAHVEVDLDGHRHRLRWPRSQTLTDLLLDAGIDPPHSCRQGHCGSCVATVVAGEVDMASCDILEPEDLRDGLILACQARPVTAEVRIEF
jgi:ferredoxin